MSGKKFADALKKYDIDQQFTPTEALGIVKQCASAKFDETVDVAVRLGVDPRKADQMVRGTVALPSGTGKDVRVAVFAAGEAAQQARDAGADLVGADDLAAEIEKGLADLAAAPGGGVVVSAATFSLAHRELIFALTARLRLPAIYWTRFFAATGGLMSYGPDTDELYAKSAAYVSRILKGAHPADLPVQTATRFETVINLRTARALGLQIAPSLASSADETIE